MTIMERGLVSIDQWTAWSQAYFLTHLHSDHTSGLSALWSKGPVFCSRLSAKLFPFKFPDFKLSLLRILDIGSWHTLPLVSPSTGSKTLIEVMAIDAHHCPGAVMFLFRGDFGYSLCTGDFRWEVNSERARTGRSMLLSALNGGSVDTLYLDNTYCNPLYLFPPREIAAQLVVDIIASHPHHDIIIGIDTLGKEDLLLHISHVLKLKIWVWPERLQIMHLLGLHEIFTTKTSLTRIRAVPRYSFSIETLEGLNKVRPTIGIMPSGLPWRAKPFEGNDNLFDSFLPCYNKSNLTSEGGIWIGKPNESLQYVERLHKYIYSVPYSDHSCFYEIEEFIKLVRPIKIKGIVSSSSCYVDPLYYFGRSCGVNQPSKVFPTKHKRKKERDGTILLKNSMFDRSSSKELERRRGKNVKVKLLGAVKNRVRALRRARCGAKIVENDFSD